MPKESTTISKTENVLIRAGECAITILPEFGGKIASIRVGDLELLQAPLAPISQRTETMAFDEADASGWDECLPSVAACTLETAGGVVSVPDHGDLWRVEWEKREPTLPTDRERTRGAAEWIREQRSGNGRSGDASVTLVGKCFSLPLELERSLTLREMEGGWRLSVDYRLTNTGSHPVPWSWAAHPLFAAGEGDRIHLPESIRSMRLEGSGGNRLGRNGDTVSWPMAMLADGSCSDLSVAHSAEAGTGDKLFAGPFMAHDNWCILERPSSGVRIRLQFDPSATPYLGLWICYGGWPDKAGPKQTCVAMEPATAPVDSLAADGAWSRVLAPAETFSWPMEIEIELTER